MWKKSFCVDRDTFLIKCGFSSVVGGPTTLLANTEPHAGPSLYGSREAGSWTGPWRVYYAAVLRVTLATMQKENFPTRINEELHFVIISLSLPLNRHETLKSSQLFLHTAGMTHAQIQRDECLTFCSALICFVRKLKHIKHQTFGSWCSCSHWIIGALTLNNFQIFHPIISNFWH